jgi:hypothetical protein
MKYTIPELREKTRIQFQPEDMFEWMTKLTNEEIAEWEAETIELAKAFITKDKREITKQEIRSYVRDKAIILDRDYKLTTIG